MPSSIISPFPVFNDLDGTPLENGYIYIGQSNLNPETAPVNVYWDAARTIPAPQPIRTIGGFPSRNGSPSNVYVEADTYSITVRNSRRVFVYSAFDQTDAPSSVFDISTQVITATAGQTTFALTTFTYLPGTDTLQVYRNGLRLTSGTDYVESSTSTVTLTTAAAAGDEFLFQGGSVITGNSTPGTSVSFIQAGTGAVTRNMQDKAREIVSVLDFGAVGDGVTDDTTAIQAAIVTGAGLNWPGGTYRTTQSIICSSEQTWFADGKVTVLYDAASGSAVAPVLDFRSKIFILGNFVINQQANTKSFANPVIYGGEAGAGSAILVQADYSNIDGITVINAWGNGIFVAKYTTPSTSTFISGSPKYVSISNVKTILCGVGDKQGGGIGIGSASLCVVSNCIDNASYNGFILDTGGGGQCMFVNCQAMQTKKDALVAGSGYGFYVGGTDSTFTNCCSFLSEFRGFWHDTGLNIDYVNCLIYAPAYDGLYIKTGVCNFKNLRVKGASNAGLNLADAILIDSSAAAINSVSIDCQINGSNHRYAVNTTGANQIDAYVYGNATAATAIIPTIAVNHTVGTNFQSLVKAGLWGFNKNSPVYTHDIFGRTRLTAGVANQSYLVSVFGDVSGNGTTFIEDFANNAKRAAWGYDPVNDCFVIQSIHAGVTTKPLFLNPSGGEVMVGNGTWNNATRMGPYRLWVDGSGRLRIKNGAPSSDTDGTVVGTQS